MSEGTQAPYAMLLGVGSKVDEGLLNGGCEDGAPHVFSRVSYFREWIRDQTGI